MPVKFTTSVRITGLLLGFFLMMGPQLSYAWNISSFEENIKIEKDSKIIVTETIVADYSSDPHHGILRFIPVDYKDAVGNNLSLDFTLLSVTDENGTPWNYTKSSAGDNIEIKIGDADIFLDRPSTFKITYEINGAITYFEDHDELYWNITGNEWDTDIKNAKATITLPTPVENNKLQATCYTGGTGSEAQNCTTSIQDGQVSITLNTGLDAYEGMTGVIGFPKGIVSPPPVTQSIIRFIKSNWGYALPLIVFALLFYHWYTRGRDPKTNKDTIMPTFTPPDKLTPAEIGTIVDEKVDMQDITSTIIDLAVRGYLKIVETKEKKLLFDSTEFEFQKLKDFNNDSGLSEHEKKLLRAVFGSLESRKLSDLKEKFYKDLPNIKNQVYNQVVQKGYFTKNPETVRTTYLSIGLALIGMSIFGSAAIISFGSLGLVVGLVISGILFAIFSRFMAAKSHKGAECYYQILGLKEYINTAEKDRLKFQEQENIFEKLLPYAMVLGIADKWTKSFEGIYKTAPSWYSSNDPSFMNNFSTFYLLHHLNSVSNSMNTTFASSPRSASGGGSGFGGGFSGGGFGGGGGSSW